MTADENKQNFIGTSEAQLRERFTNWKPYRIHQIFNWVYHYGCRDFSKMTNLFLGPFCTIPNRAAENRHSPSSPASPRKCRC